MENHSLEGFKQRINMFQVTKLKAHTRPCVENKLQGINMEYCIIQARRKSGLE